MRPCSKCGVQKPWTVDYFRSYTYKGRCALRGKCRQCEGYKGEGSDRRMRRGPLTEEERASARSLYNRNFFEKDPERARAIWRASSKRNRATRSEYQKRYRAENADKVKDWNKAWREANKDRLQEYMREYEPKWRAANSEKRRAAVKRWRQKNPKRAHHSTQRYWARKHGAEGSHTFSQKQGLLRKQGHRCFYCGESLAEYHADHFIPLSKGGSDYIENIRMACPPCNLSKSDKMPWEWMPERFSAP